jgi:uncharacterized membrane protein
MTDTAPTPTTERQRRRWIGPLLIASLAINFLVLGAVAGWAWRHGPRDHWRGPHGGAERILWLLPEAKRDAAKAIIARHQQGEEGRDADGKAARAAVLAALTAEPFSRPALEQALSTLASTELSRRLQPAVIGEIAETLSLGERKDLATHIEQMMERRGRWGDRRS